MEKRTYRNRDAGVKDKIRLRPQRRFARLGLIFFIFVLSTHLLMKESPASIDEIQRQKSTEALHNINGLTEADREHLVNRIEETTYKKRRLLLAFCQLPDIEQNDIAKLFTLVDNLTLPFSFIPLLENFTSTPHASLENTEKLVKKLGSTTFVSEKTVSSLAFFQADNSTQFFMMLDRIEELDEPAQWAVQSLMNNIRPSPSLAFFTIDHLAVMSDKQCRAAEQLFRISRLEEETLPSALQRLSRLPGRDAEILRSLFMQETFSAATLYFWLDGYFATAPVDRDEYFRKLSADEKSLLLAAHHQDASIFIWIINNLHDVTDNFGQEIGSGRLAGYSPEKLSHLFNLLHPLSRQKYGSGFYRGLENADKAAAITSLRQATAHSRKQEAEDLSSGHIYALLANGSELYDSSFRDILVPILKKRIASDHHDRLLDFLTTADSSNMYVSDFITNLAQKGKLTTFFPEESDQQKKILDLTVDSALSDEESLILFSATFSRLLQNLQPAARSYLLDLLLDGINRNTTYSGQVQVILQYYFREHPQLLASDDKQKIETLLKERDPIDLTPYITAPFDQWREDGRLASLSVFQNDDDGRSSYISYCRTLLENGYRPEVSRSYGTVSPGTSLHTLQQLITDRERGTPQKIATFFRISSRSPLAIDWKKRVNNIEITHTVYVYTGQRDQEKLFMVFLESGQEMFAQRGHSYWRDEQLFQPLDTLMKENKATSEIFDAKQRFISLGSCGGIRAYSMLNTIFRSNVDILATVGTGKAAINNPYNQRLLELIADNDDIRTWRQVARKFSRTFSENLGGDYIQPGSLPAILHKMRNSDTKYNGTD